MPKYTVCKFHGKQKAIGNYDECEQCLIDYKKEQMEKIDKEEKRILGKRY